jgi:hypothetical protein
MNCVILDALTAEKMDVRWWGSHFYRRLDGEGGMLERRLERSVLHTKKGVQQQRDGWCRSSWMDLKNGWMSWVWTAVTILMVDQRVGEVSSCRQRRAQYRAVGVPSTRGGNLVRLSGSFPEPERNGSPANSMYQP